MIYTKVNIYVLSKIVTRVYIFLEGIMKGGLKCSLDIQPKHTNLLCTLYGLQKGSSCFCNVAGLWESIMSFRWDTIWSVSCNEFFRYSQSKNLWLESPLKFLHIFLDLFKYCWNTILDSRMSSKTLQMSWQVCCRGTESNFSLNKIKSF